MKLAMTARVGLLLALSAAIISGFAVFINSTAVKTAPSPLAFTTAKNLVAAILVAAILSATAARKQIVPVMRGLKRPQWLALAYVGVVSGGVAFALFFQGLAGANATEAAFTQKSLIIWVVLLSVPFLHEKIGARQGVAIGLLIIGQILLAAGVTGKPGTLGALGLVLVATLMWSVEIIIVRRWLRPLPASLLATVRLGVGSVVLLVWLGAVGGISQLAGMGSAWGWALVTGVILTGYVLTWFGGLRRAAAVDVTAILVLGAFITAVLSLPGTTVVTVAQVTGMILILGGTVVLLWRRLAAKRTPAPPTLAAGTPS